MCCFVHRYSAGALAFALAVVLPTGRAPGGPVSALANPAVKIDEIEKAGVALKNGQTDEAYRLLGEAVRKYPYLPPARLMLARLFLNTTEGQKQGRAVLEVAAAEEPE